VSFVNRFVERLTARPELPAITEVHGSTLVPCSGRELLALTARARGALRRAGAPGDRAVLLAPNGARWVAADLALLAEGRVVVPMYPRQDPKELVEMMRDADPSVVLCATPELLVSIRDLWPEAPLLSFDELFAGDPVHEPPHDWAADDDVTIIYTSGTSGAAKGVVTKVSHVDYMLPVTAEAIASMMALGGPVDGDDRVFHYLPFCFAGSRVVLWTCLWRGNGVMVSTDLEHLAQEMGAAKPHYFLNVPMLLERIKAGVEKNLKEQPAVVRWLVDRAKAAHGRRAQGQSGRRDRLTMALAERLVFSKIREKIGPNLRCLICGSAPLGEETQRWFEMLGLAVYQVYGLTETTAIVTMDRPPAVKPGRVGRALPGVELKLGDGDELLVRGPNVFDRYWRREQATAEVFVDGWFKTGDQAEVDADGNWRIIGRTKNILVPSSGHNVAPEPIEQLLVEGVPGVEQALLVGHGRPYLAALIGGPATDDEVQRGLDRINEGLPHYRKVRRFHRVAEPFTIENGLLTANRKLKRGAIERAYAAAIDAMYAR
jgi:long-chain acyl-CoA synthetase